MLCTFLAMLLNFLYNIVPVEKREIDSNKLPIKKSFLKSVMHSKLRKNDPYIKEIKNIIPKSFHNNTMDVLLKNSLLQYHNFNQANAPNQTVLQLKTNKINASIISFLGFLLLENEDIFQQWIKTKVHICGNSLIAFSNEFAISKNIIINTKYGYGKKGGEEIIDVLNQDEEAEYYSFQFGFMELPCKRKSNYFFNSQNHLNSWYESLQPIIPKKIQYDIYVEQFTIAITRYEYVNIYHTMTDIYNCYLLMRFFNKTRYETNIVIIDGHPKGSLDLMWKNLFNSSQIIGNLNGRIFYKNLVWGILGYHSEILQHLTANLPLVEDFSNFVLNSYGLEKQQKLECRKLKVVFIWRRDYLAHPRNPTGKVSRKISNENELITSLRSLFPKWNISGVQLDTLDIKSQLDIISNTNILIGMHGAGLTHAFFLPKHSALLEIIPNYWQRAKDHFQSIAQWRNLIYQSWTNNDTTLETDEHISYIPPDVIQTMTKNVHKLMCKG